MSVKVDARRMCGPQGGITRWAVYFDGALFILHGTCLTFDTKREALFYGRGYVKRHPEKFAAQPESKV